MVLEEHSEICEGSGVIETEKDKIELDKRLEVYDQMEEDEKPVYMGSQKAVDKSVSSRKFLCRLILSLLPFFYNDSVFLYRRIL